MPAPPTAIPRNLPSGVRSALAASVPLAVAFGGPAGGAGNPTIGGRYPWLYYDAVPADIPRPNAAVSADVGTTRGESGGGGPAGSFVGSAAVAIVVLTDTIGQDRARARKQALDLGRLITDLLAAPGFVVAFALGQAMDFRRTNPLEGPKLDRDKGTQGQDIYRQVLRFQAFVGST